MRSSTISKVVTLVFTISVILTPSLTQAKDSFDILPGNTLFALKITDLQQTTSDLDLFMTGISPMPISVSALANMQLGTILCNPTLEGIDSTGDFTIFANMTSDAEVESVDQIDAFICLLVPTSDFETFVNSSRSIIESETPGIYNIACKVNPSQLEPITVKMKQLNSYAAVLVTGSEGAFKELKPANAKSLKSALSPNQIEIASNNDIFFYENIRHAYRKFEPLLTSQLEETTDKIAMNTPEGMGLVSDFMQSYINLVKSVLEQADTATIAIDFKPELCIITTDLKAIEDSAIGKALQSTSPTKTPKKLNNFIDDNSAMTVIGQAHEELSLALKDETIDLYSLFMSKEDAATYFDKSMQLAETTGKQLISMDSDIPLNTPIAMNYAIELKDAEKAEEQIEQLLNAVSNINIEIPVGEETIKYDIETLPTKETYKGVKISHALLKFDFSGILADMEDEFGDMPDGVPTENINYYWAIVDDLLLVSCSDDNKTIQSLIDKAMQQSLASEPENFKKAIDLIPDARESSLYGTFNYVNLMKNIAANVESNGEFPPASVMNSINTQSSISFAFDLKDSSITSKIAVPKQHIIEIAQIFTTMMMMQMQQAAPPMPNMPIEDAEEMNFNFQN